MRKEIDNPERERGIIDLKREKGEEKIDTRTAPLTLIYYTDTTYHA